MALPLPPGAELDRELVRCPFCDCPCDCGDCRDCPECEGTGLVRADAPIPVRPVVRVRRVLRVLVELGDAE